MIFDDANKGIAQAYLSMLSESHFEVGDKVKCKASGMTGTVTKLDKEDGGEDEKYYTVKQDSGKVMKYAPSELKKLNESMMNEATQKPMRGDSINFDLDGKNVTAMVLSVSGNKAVVRSVKGKHTVDLSKIDYTVVADEATKLDPVNKKAVKKDFDNRQDKDIDNDGDVDDSDEYLHKRRKAVSKAMKDEAMEIELPKKSKSNLKDDDDDGDYDYDDDDDDDDDDGEAKAKKKKDMKESHFIGENYRKLAQQGIGTESKKSAKTGQMIDFYEPNQGNKKSGKIVKVASDHYVVRDDDGGKEYKFQFYTNKAKLGEDFQRIYELSKDTLTRYSNAAKGQHNDAMDKLRSPVSGSEFRKQSKTMAKRSRGYGAASKRLNREDLEQVDELSKKTLGSYVNKANSSSATTGIEAGSAARGGKSYDQESKKLSNRALGVSRAVNRLTKEDVEGVDESSLKDMRAAAEKRAGSVMKPKATKPKPKPRPGSIEAMRADAEKRRMREDVEEIDELSKKTLGSYAKKGMQDYSDRLVKYATGTDATKDSAKKINKRGRGLDKAVDRLAKEDLEWDWESILEAPEEEIDALIEELSDEDFDSFYSELESLEEGANMYYEAKDMSKVASEIEAHAKKKGGIDKNDMMKVASMIKRGQVKQAMDFAQELDSDPRDFILDKMGMMEGANMYQASTSDTQPTDITGRETLEPRAQADREFADMHRDSTNVKDYPGKNRQDGSMRMSQAPVRPGEKRNSEPKKTLSDIRRRM